MSNFYMPGGTHAWYTPGQIFTWLQEQRYQVFSILYDDQWYVVEARDPEGTWVELKVTPKTRTIIAWKFLEEPCCEFSQDG
ncbi:hypothetical protein [uncultured Nitrospira sp.]|uniref:hypothetical protein n=1 Tax=uncultured Nitrospira sp. TaxID=157176 RepID=UPI003140705D